MAFIDYESLTDGMEEKRARKGRRVKRESLETSEGMVLASEEEFLDFGASPRNRKGNLRKKV